MNNAYFEGQERAYLEGQSDDQLIMRAKEIEGLAQALESSNAWHIVLKDAEKWKEQMDNLWQDVYDENQLRQMRVVKQAYKFLIQIPERYEHQVKVIQSEIRSRQDFRATEDST